MTEVTRPVDAYVGGKAATEFVAQAQAGFHLGETRTDIALRIVLAIEVQLQLRAEDQPLGEQQVVVCLQPRSRASLRTGIERGHDLKPVRRQSLHAHSGPLA